MNEALLQLAFASGGGLGAVARHALAQRMSHPLPWSTLLVNVLGSLVLGLAAAWLAQQDVGAGDAMHRMAVGFCGGFTTFSSFAYQSLGLYRQQTVLHAAGNVLVSLGSCVLAYAAGLFFFFGM